MQWLNEPASWQRTGDVLRVSVDPGTDFWRTTGYGYVHDNGHVYGDLLPGDLDVSVRVRGAFTNQYDQAGIMLRADEQTWLKTGLEFFEGRPRFSTVLTMGWSSWMVADLPPGTDEVTLRVSRRGDAVEVRYAAGDGPAELAALVFLPPDREMLAGIVCAAPEGTGFSAAFHDLRIVGREWAGQGAADGADWVSEPAAAAAGWAEEAAGTGASWAGDAQGWDERAENGPAEWAGDKGEERAAGWAGDEAEEGAAGWAGDEARKLRTGGGRSRGRGSRLGRTSPAPSGWAETPSGEPAGRDGAPAESDTLDWAKPQASEPAADWERLSLGVATSWNAFAAAAPADEPLAEQEQEPAEEPPAAGRTSSDSPGSEDGGDSTDSAAREGGDDSPASKGGNDSADRKVNKAGKASPDSKASSDSKDNAQSVSTTGRPRKSAADDKTEPVPPEPGPPPAPAEPGKPDAQERSARRRNKAKPSAPQLPTPADPADEWISLLTADSADELSRPEVNRTRREPDRGGPDTE
jgi:regulation of enolase protein 1 (concanavalin A-like superfamily)